MMSGRGGPTEVAGLPAILAIDPGGTTGWAVFAFYHSSFADLREGVAFWTCGEFVGPENDQVDELVELALAWPAADIVIEDFILRQFNMDRALLSPVRITAAFSWAMRGTGIAGGKWKKGQERTFSLQQPSLAMSTVTDARLRSWGYWDGCPGPHARDAVRHALTFARRK
jgi:hypothetical protein